MATAKHNHAEGAICGETCPRRGEQEVRLHEEAELRRRRRDTLEERQRASEADAERYANEGDALMSLAHSALAYNLREQRREIA